MQAFFLHQKGVVRAKGLRVVLEGPYTGRGSGTLLQLFAGSKKDLKGTEERLGYFISKYYHLFQFWFWAALLLRRTKTPFQETTKNNSKVSFDESTKKNVIEKLHK